MTRGKRIAVVVGTRPEAIKMAPVYRALADTDGVEPVLISSGQHRELLDSALEPLGLEPDYELSVMSQGQTPNDVASRVLERLPPLLEEIEPAVLLVQGDTTTVLAAALAAYHLGVPVGHVEAGLRTYDHRNPFPEEGNRQLVDRISRWCFAPTETSAENLRRERIDEASIHVTGNTAVDSLLWMLERPPERPVPKAGLLITLHRRESFGEPLREILEGVKEFLDATPDATALWPVHPNPNVRKFADDVLSGVDRLELVAPLEYRDFVHVLAACRLVLTDSGGIQEEAPSLGKRVLVARETTERPEAVTAGLNRLLGRDRNEIAAGLANTWTEPTYRSSLPAANPYGDGKAGRRIAEILCREA